MPAKSALGLFFTDQYIEIAELSGDGDRLLKYNHINLPAGLVVNGEIKNGQALVQTISQLLTTAKPSSIETGQDVVIGINDNKVFLRELIVPKVLGKDVSDAIDYQVRAILPVLPAGVETDWQIIGKNDEGQIEVLLAAVPKTIIDACVAACSAAGLRVVAIEPAVFANIRILQSALTVDKNQLMVYLGDTFGTFSLITGGNPRFSDFLPQSEIEKNGIVKTVESYINFANSKTPSRQVQEVLVSGFSVDIDRVVAELKSKNINTVKASSRLGTNQVVDHTLLRTALGLSLKMMDQRLTLNLLPIEDRLNVIRRRLIHSWKNILVVLILLTFIGISGLAYFYYMLRVQERRLTIQKMDIEQQLSQEGSAQLISEANELNILSGRLVQLRQVTGGEENILKILSAVTPPEVTLTSLLFTRNPGATKLLDIQNSWIITGTANSRPVVLSFYDNLLAQPDFSEARLYFGSLEKDVGLNFRIANQPRL